MPGINPTEKEKAARDRESQKALEDARKRQKTGNNNSKDRRAPGKVVFPKTDKQ